MSNVRYISDNHRLVLLDDHREWYPPLKVMEAANASLEDIKRERAAKCVMLQQYDQLLDSDIEAMVSEHREIDYLDIVGLISAVAGAISTIGEEDSGATVKVDKDQFALIRFQYEREG